MTARKPKRRIAPRKKKGNLERWMWLAVAAAFSFFVGVEFGKRYERQANIWQKQFDQPHVTIVPQPQATHRWPPRFPGDERDPDGGFNI